MILPLLLVLQDAPAPDDEVAEEIVVIGERLKTFRASVTFKNGPHCKVKRSTGDAAIDGVFCQAIQTCWPQFHPRFDATLKLASAERKPAQAALNSELAECSREQGDTLVAQLAGRRVEARQ